MDAVAALRDLAVELALPAGKTWLLLNRPYGVPGGAPSEALGLPLLAALPHDPRLPSWETEGRSFLDLPPGESPAADAVTDALRTRLLGPAP
jgi:hypothetical protein